ncbi:MAG TPA: hypothetical protein VKS60_00260 [Stellaceae bacterium]|nr:hypothetical protein [Stellaceae bacterium]
MIRETAYAALFAVLEALRVDGTVVVADRRLRSLNDLNAAELPALFMTVGDQKVVARHGLPPKRTLTADIYLYAANPDPGTAAGIQLNGLIDAVEAVLAPPVYAAVQTLGGAVEHCFIEGTIAVYEAPKGQRAAALLPVHLLLP